MLSVLAPIFGNPVSVTKKISLTTMTPDRAKENGSNGEEGVNGAAVATDVIRITGRKDNCEAAKEALISLVPINIEVSFDVCLWYCVDCSFGRHCSSVDEMAKHPN
jgi:hypothetical protein